MNLLRVPVLLRVARILQQFPGLARRAGAQAVRGRRFHAIADNLFFGDLLEVQGGLDSLMIAVHRRRRRVSRRRTPGRRARHFLVLRLYGRAGSRLLHLPRPSGVFRRQSTGLRVSLQPVPGPGPRQLPLHVLLEIVLLLLGDHLVQYDEEHADNDGEQTYGDQFVPPSAGRFGAPLGEIPGQQTAHQEERAEH